MKTKHTTRSSLLLIAVLVVLLGLVTGLTFNVSPTHGVAFATPSGYDVFWVNGTDFDIADTLEVEYVATEISPTIKLKDSNGIETDIDIADIEYFYNSACNDPVVDGESVPIAPTAIGHYWVKMYDSTHDLVAENIPLDIVPAKIDIDWDDPTLSSNVSMTYGETPFDFSDSSNFTGLFSGVVGGETITVSAQFVNKSNNDEPITVDSHSNVGPYWLKASIGGTNAANYQIKEDDVYHDFFITQKTITISEWLWAEQTLGSGTQTILYTGHSAAITAHANDGNAELEIYWTTGDGLLTDGSGNYYIDNENDYDEILVNGAPVNVNDTHHYFAVVSPVDTTNYCIDEDDSSQFLCFDIARRELTIVWAEGADPIELDYNGEEQMPSYVISASSGLFVESAASRESVVIPSVNNGLLTENGKHTNAGVYDGGAMDDNNCAVVTLEDTTNYIFNISGGLHIAASAEYTINKITPDIRIQWKQDDLGRALAWMYGENKSPDDKFDCDISHSDFLDVIVSGETTNGAQLEGALAWRWSTDNWANSAPGGPIASTALGTEVKIKLVSSATTNYNASESNDITFNIEKIRVFVVPSATNLVYTGVGQKPDFTFYKYEVKAGNEFVDTSIISYDNTNDISGFVSVDDDPEVTFTLNNTTDYQLFTVDGWQTIDPSTTLTQSYSISPKELTPTVDINNLVASRIVYGVAPEIATSGVEGSLCGEETTVAAGIVYSFSIDTMEAGVSVHSMYVGDQIQDVIDYVATINVGTYRLTFNFIDNTNPTNYISAGAAYIDFEIIKADLTVAANAHSITYGDESANNGYTMSGFKYNQTEEMLRGSSTLSGSVTYSYNYEQWGNVGSYTITPILTGLAATNYNFVPSAGTLTVEAADFVSYSVAQQSALTYNGQAQGNVTYSVETLRDADDSGWLITYSTTPSSYTATLPKFVDAGDHTVYYELTRSNYNTVHGSYTLTIAKKALRVDFSNIDTKVYTGSNIDPDGAIRLEDVVTADKTGEAVNAAKLYINYTTDSIGAGDYPNKGFAIGGASASNYVLTADTGYAVDNAETNTGHLSTFTIRKKTLTFAWTGLSVQDAVYDGTEKSVTATISGGIVAGDEGKVSILNYSNNSKTDAGDYTAQVTALSGDKAINYTPEGSVNETFDWAITPATITNIDLHQTGTLTYNATAQTATVYRHAETVNSIPYGITFSTEENGVYGADVPAFTTAGNHTVWYQITAENHTTVKDSLIVVIGKKTATIIPDADQHKTYGASNPGSYSFTVSGIEAADEDYVGVYGSITRADGEAAGTYAFEQGAAHLVDETVESRKDNYSLALADEVYTIDKRVVEFSKYFDSDSTKHAVTYDGASHTFHAVVTNKATFGDNEDVVNIAVSMASRTDAGTYNTVLTLTGAKAANYEFANGSNQREGSTYEDARFIIAPRPVVIAWDADSFPYTGSAQNVTATITNIIDADDENVTIEYNTAGYTDAGDYTTTVTDLTGTRAFNYTLTGGTNLSKNWSITKVDPTRTLPTAIAGLTYTGASQVLINAGVSEDGMFEYKLGDGDWTTDIAHYIVGTEAQDYVVRFRFTGDENHNDIAATVIEGVKIGKAASSVTTAPTAASNLVYDGNAHYLLASTGVAAGGTMKFSLDGETWNTSIPQATDANLVGYTVWYKVAGDEDHSDTTPVAIENIVIAKADPVVSGIELRAGWTYNGESNTLITNFGSVDYGTLVFADSATGDFAALTNINVTDADTYEVWYKVEAGANWNAVEPTLVDTVTVAPRPVSLSWSDDSEYVYDGEVHNVLATITNIVNEDEVSVQYYSGAMDKVNATSDSVYHTTAITLTGADKDNYTLSGGENLSKDWTIAKRPAALKMFIDGVAQEGLSVGVVYDGTQHTFEIKAQGIEADGWVGQVDYVFEITNVSNDGTTLNTAYQGFDNYVPDDSYHFTWAVAKRSITLSVDIDEHIELIYGDEIDSMPIDYIQIDTSSAYGFIGDPEDVIVATVALKAGNDFVPVMSLAEVGNVGRYYLYVMSLDEINYDIDFLFDEDVDYLEIVPRPLTITPTALGKVYGEADPAELTYHVSNFAEGEENAVQLEGALVRAAGEDAGSYLIGLGTLALKDGVAANANYELELAAVNFVINKAVYDMSGVTFAPINVVYDGQAHVAVIAGDLPQGVTVEYINASRTSAGSQTAKARFSGDANHEAIAEMSAAINISKATYDMSGITFADVEATYDGQAHVAVITGNLPQGVAVSYTDATLTDAGTIDAIAHFNGDTTNYNAIPDMNATITINKAAAVFNLEGVVREFKYTGANFSISGATVSGGGAISYVNNSFSAVGEHVVTINAAASANYLAGSTTVTVVVLEADPVANPDGSKSYYKVVDEQAAAGAGVDVSDIFESAKADATAKDVKLEVGEVTIVFNGAALDAIGGNDVALKVVVGEEAGAEMVLNITLNGATFAEGKATVSVPYANAVPSGKVVKVYFVDADGSKTDMDATLVDGVLSFDTNHFSKYIVAVEDVPKSGLSGGAIAGIVIAVVVVVAGAAVGVFFFLKKKKGAAPKADEPQAEELPEEPKEEEPKDAE